MLVRPGDLIIVYDHDQEKLALIVAFKQPTVGLADIVWYIMPHESCTLRKMGIFIDGHVIAFGGLIAKKLTWESP